MDGLKHGDLSAGAVHICVDMQNLFAADTDWHTPWLPRVLPQIVALVKDRAVATIFTRFIPVRQASEAHGMWRAYYERWQSMTQEQLSPTMLDLVPDLAEFAPPGEIVDKQVYSPWMTPQLSQSLARRGADTLIITGGETDVCVLATVLGAVDRGFRVVLAEDCLCSSSDQTHDALLTLYTRRFSQQIEVAPSEEILDRWRR
jgi:nicotinamidase-related amidase